jgi:hypothetical protein
MRSTKLLCFLYDDGGHCALANMREVYGIRRLCFDREAHTLRVEYDATRLNAATVIQLVRSTGLQVVEEVQVALPPPVTEPAPAA